MPIYQYYEIFPDGSEGEPFDVSQKMSDPPLERHPHIGNPVKKCFLVKLVCNNKIIRKQSNISTHKNLEKRGFYLKKTKQPIRCHKKVGTDKRAPDTIDLTSKVPRSTAMPLKSTRIALDKPM